METNTQYYQKEDHPAPYTGNFLITFGISLFGHLLFFAVLIFASEYTPRQQDFPSYIRVKMVQPEMPAPTAEKEKEQVRADEPAKESEPGPSAPEPAPDISLAAADTQVPEDPRGEDKDKDGFTVNQGDCNDNDPSIHPGAPEKCGDGIDQDCSGLDMPCEHKAKKVEKPVEPAHKSRKKGVGKTDEAKKKLKKGVVKKPEKTYQDAIAAIRQMQSEQKTQNGSHTGTGESGTPGGTSLAAQRDMVNTYSVEVAHEIQKQWAFPEGLVGRDENIWVGIVFKVMPDGSISDIRFGHRSGNRYMDESALKAVHKAEPVSAHPNGISRRYVEVMLKFTPEGLQ